ncbi:MAG: molybdenum cofactor biosynthesis protein MoaE [Aquabacterium sp.]|nr:MAG: molybdenum cofactor biosynthesis protein MoaE [Aquabacterium sp.]
MDGGRWQVRVQAEDFDLSTEVAALRAGDPGIGAVASFVGTVRDQQSGEALQALEIEHYPGMTQQAIEAMLAEARGRFELRGACIVHRVGRLAACEQIVLVATVSAHREQALSACAFLMDWLKTGAPFWKKAVTASGSHWVEAKASDDAAVQRWGVDGGNSRGGPA